MLSPLRTPQTALLLYPLFSKYSEPLAFGDVDLRLDLPVLKPRRLSVLAGCSLR